MSLPITLIPGDGIGPEISESAMKVLEAAGLDIEWDIVEAGAQALEDTGELLPESVHRSIRRNRIALKGPITTPVGGGHQSLNVALRKRHKLYANIRPIKLIPGVSSRYRGENMDMVLFRENTEDLYSGLEHEVTPGVVETLKVITAKASTRIAKLAFQYAEWRNRRKITAVHKANIMKLSDGLFLKCARKIAKHFPHLEYEEIIVDNCCLQIVLNPAQFDVILLPNLYGDILSDLCAGLVGGLGVTPGGNIGDKVAIFESVHGSAPDIAGKNQANPTALILSAAMMLRHLKRDAEAFLIREAVARVISRGQVLTRDLGGTASTTEFTTELVRQVKRQAKRQSKSKKSRGTKRAPRR